MDRVAANVLDVGRDVGNREQVDQLDYDLTLIGRDVLLDPVTHDRRLRPDGGR